MLLCQLPDDVLYHIFSYLDYKSLGRLSQVCKSTYHFINRDAVWRRIAKDFLNTGITRNGTDRWENCCSMMRNLPSVFSLALAWAVLCTYPFMTVAAPLLCFQLFDALIGSFISPNSGHRLLKRLQLILCQCVNCWRKLVINFLLGLSIKFVRCITAHSRTITQVLVNELWWL